MKANEVERFSLNYDQTFVMEEITRWFRYEEDGGESPAENVMLVHGAFGCGKRHDNL
jgi:hypothetical protein